MIGITIEEACRMRGYRQQDLAIELGFCDSLISKIKNGTQPITEDVQDKFKKHFKGFELKGGSIRWKDKYNALKVRYDALELRFKELEKEQKAMKKRLKVLKKFSEE